MTEPQLIASSLAGRNNEELAEAADRIRRGRAYEDLSTICVIPTRGTLKPLIVDAWLSLAKPMNGRFAHFFVQGMEVGAAYSAAVQMIIDHPELSKWKYLLTMEEDNIPPMDGLLKLYESIKEGPYAAVGGLYWTKGEGGQPMIYGDPAEPLNFRPQPPPSPDEVEAGANPVVECHGLGMGFTLFDLSIFRDERLPRPWFQTLQTFDPYKPPVAATQDLFFFGEARKLGLRFACDTRVRVGHLDVDTGVIW